LRVATVASNDKDSTAINVPFAFAVKHRTFEKMVPSVSEAVGWSAQSQVISRVRHGRGRHGSEMAAGFCATSDCRKCPAGSALLTGEYPQSELTFTGLLNEIE
jgi:hypothetical protein